MGFDPNYGLIKFTPQNQVFPSPCATRLSNGTDLLEFLGLMVGKAMYEGMLLEVELAPLFVMALQKWHPALEDLSSLDETLYKSLLQVGTALMNTSRVHPDNPWFVRTSAG
jgi:ubiquitin-protein ligase E3 C